MDLKLISEHSELCGKISHIFLKMQNYTIINFHRRGGSVEERLQDREGFQRGERGVVQGVIPEDKSENLIALRTVEPKHSHIVESHAGKVVENRRLISVEVVVVQGRGFNESCVLQVEKTSLRECGCVGGDSDVSGYVIEEADVKIGEVISSSQTFHRIGDKEECSVVRCAFAKQHGKHLREKERDRRFHGIAADVGSGSSERSALAHGENFLVGAEVGDTGKE